MRLFLGLKPERVVADTAYGTAKFLGWLIDVGIRPRIPVWDKSTREDDISRVDFTFDKERNVYICPAGNSLTTDFTVEVFTLRMSLGIEPSTTS